MLPNEPPNRLRLKQQPPPDAKFRRRIGVVIFGAALALRLVWLAGVVQTHGAEGAVRLYPDSMRYQCLAETLLGRPWGYPADVEMMRGDPAYRSGEGALLLSGPGYGLFIAAIYRLFGDSPWPVLLVQTVLSSLSCVLIGLLGGSLFQSVGVAAASGIVAACSLTSLTLSAMYATETLFLALFVAALLCGLRGLRADGWRWLSAYAVLVSLAAMVKPVLQVWCALSIVLALALLVSRRVPRRGPLGKLLLVSLLPLFVLVGWATRNGVRHGVFTVAATASHSLQYYWAAFAVADADPNRDVLAVQRDWSEDYARRYAEKPLSFAEPHREDLAVFSQTCRAHSWGMVRAFARNALLNCIAPSDLHPEQTPHLRPVWRVLDPFLRRIWGPLLPLAALVSGVWMFAVGRRWEAVMLLAICAYFVILSGVTCWAGSRYFHPAQPGWCVLLAWGACRLWRRVTAKPPRLRPDPARPGPGPAPSGARSAPSSSGRAPSGSGPAPSRPGRRRRRIG